MYSVTDGLTMFLSLLISKPRTTITDRDTVQITDENKTCQYNSADWLFTY